MVQRPYVTTLAHLTTAVDQPSGPRYGYAWRTEPLGRWNLQYKSLTDAELAVLEAFFASMRGRYGAFIYLDPGGNLVQYSEDFTNASWSNSASIGGAVADPFGGNRALSATGTSLSTCVLPSGGASGFVLCGSIWVKMASAQTLSVGFIDSNSSPLGSTAWALPAGQWRRIWCSITLATASSVSLLISGSSWSAALFGAQCAPLPGPGGYQRTPGNCGLRAKCRFDTDRFEVQHVGPNENGLQLKVAEYK